MFTGWPPDATAFLAEIADDNTGEFWLAHRHRYEAAVATPTRALAAELAGEFGAVRVLRPYRNRRFSPGAPPYRVDAGGVASTAAGATLGVVLSAAELSVSAGHWLFDARQVRRFRAAVDGPGGADLAALLRGWPESDPVRALTGTPRGYPAAHPRIGLLRRRGLQVGCSWPVGEWLATVEPLHRVRAAWRAAAPVLAWLDEHVGPAAPVPPRPRPTPEV